MADAAWTQKMAQEKLRELFKRATTDAEFRRLALKDPHAAIAKIDPTPLPSWFKVRFVENQGATMTFVLPDMPQANDGELSDSQLEQVAGGAGSNARCGASCGMSDYGICEISAIV